MLIRLSTTRLIAMLTLGFLLGWWSAYTDPGTLAEYRALSHDALLAELASHHDGNIGTNTMGATMIVFTVVGGVELLTRVVRRAAALTRSPAAPAAPPSAPPSVPEGVA